MGHEQRKNLNVMDRSKYNEKYLTPVLKWRKTKYC